MGENNNSGATAPKMVTYPEDLLHPRDYKAPSSDNAQSQGSVNTIQKLSVEQTFNNAAQGTGVAGPAVWGGPSDKKETQSSAEKGVPQASKDMSIDPKTGQNSVWDCGRPYRG